MVRLEWERSEGCLLVFLFGIHLFGGEGEGEGDGEGELDR